MCHCSCDSLNILRLVRPGQRNSGDTWQVNKGQIRAGVGVHVQHNGFVNDVLFRSRNFVCKNINLVLDFMEVEELLAWDFVEDSPWLDVFMQVIQSQFERSSGYHTL